MRRLDITLQRWRERMARPWIPAGAKVLDIGCHQGEFLRSLGDSIGPSVGIDPLAADQQPQRHRLLAGLFRPPAPFDDASFDAIVMLATLEHIPDKDPVASECFRIMRPGGRLIVTVPSPWVDNLLVVLRGLHLVDGMSLEEHHGFDPRTTLDLFSRHGFVLERWRKFQLGLNNLFVFRKPLPLAGER